jgi:hypothetical protein
MKIYTKERISHTIERNKAALKRLQDKQENLSVWGYRDMGYYEGRISVLEDLLDDMEEDEI